MPHDAIVGDASLDMASGNLNCWLPDPPTPDRERQGSDTVPEALAIGESLFNDPIFTQDFASVAQSDGPDSYKLSHLADDDVAYLKSKKVFDLPPKEVQDELVNNYFLYVHPLLPLMGEKEFRDDYEANLSSTSLLLYRAVIFVATSVRLMFPTLRPWLTFGRSTCRKTTLKCAGSIRLTKLKKYTLPEQRSDHYAEHHLDPQLILP